MLGYSTVAPTSGQRLMSGLLPLFLYSKIWIWNRLNPILNDILAITLHTHAIYCGMSTHNVLQQNKKWKKRSAEK